MPPSVTKHNQSNEQGLEAGVNGPEISENLLGCDGGHTIAAQPLNLNSMAPNS